MAQSKHNPLGKAAFEFCIKNPNGVTSAEVARIIDRGVSDTTKVLRRLHLAGDLFRWEHAGEQIRYFATAAQRHVWSAAYDPSRPVAPFSPRTGSALNKVGKSEKNPPVVTADKQKKSTASQLGKPESKGISLGYDYRYQVDPKSVDWSKPFGAGFTAAGIGRYADAMETAK